MSVTTTSDDYIAKAKSKMEEAEKLLQEALHPDTWGSSNFNDDYKKTLIEITWKLKKWFLKI